jgi:hypothetical protein
VAVSLPPRLELEFICGMMSCTCKSTCTAGVSLATVLMWNSLENPKSTLCLLTRVSSPAYMKFRARMNDLFRSCAKHHHLMRVKGDVWLDCVVGFLCFFVHTS